MKLRAELKAAARRRLLPYRGKVARRAGKTNADIVRFQLMLDDNKRAVPLYQAGRYWEYLNGPLGDLIWAGALTNLRNEYFNRVFAGPEPSSRQVYRALLRLYFDRLLDIDTAGFLSSYEDPLEGGTGDQEEVQGGRRVSLDFLQSVEEAYRIKEAWELSGRDAEPRVIIELGAGYGRLAYVCRKLLPDCTYIILDLPQALMCASSWLERVLPGEVVPYEVGRVTRLTRSDLVRESVWIIGPEALERIPTDTADVFVNIYSFAEMRPEAIDNYFQQLDRITNGILFTKQRRRERNPFDDAEITTGSYPVRPSWRLLKQRRATLYEEFFEAAYDLRYQPYQPHADGSS